MTKYTKRRRYPYPIRTERGAGALDIESLARAFDRDAKLVETDWQTDLQRPSATWTDTDTSLPSGGDTELLSGSGAWGSTVGAFSATWQKIASYWLVSVDVGLTANGTINTNTSRILKVITEQSQVGPFALNRETYQAQDFQADATVWLATEFVTLIDENTSLSYVINHGNTGSSLTGVLRSSVTLLGFA